MTLNLASPGKSNIWPSWSNVWERATCRYTEPSWVAELRMGTCACCAYRLPKTRQNSRKRGIITSTNTVTIRVITWWLCRSFRERMCSWGHRLLNAPIVLLLKRQRQSADSVRSKPRRDGWRRAWRRPVRGTQRKWRNRKRGFVLAQHIFPICVAIKQINGLWCLQHIGGMCQHVFNLESYVREFLKWWGVVSANYA